jgi:hypothetical protein
MPRDEPVDDPASARAQQLAETEARFDAILTELKEKFAREREDRRRKGRVTDDDVDHRLFDALSKIVDGDLDRLRALPEAQRAYFATRVFEWVTMAGGPDGIVDAYGEWLDEIGTGYRVLGLSKPSDAFERYRASPIVKRLLVDSESPVSTAERAELNRLVDAVGLNDKARVRFVRSHPELFDL